MVRKKLMKAIILLCSYVAYLPDIRALDINGYKLKFDRERGAPIVYPNSSAITLMVDDDLWIRCSSPEKIVWQFAESFNHITDVVTTDDFIDGMYLSSINITKANEKHVGQYYCIKEKARDYFNEYKLHLYDLEAQFNATSIYVFVTGLQNTVVPQTENFIEAIDRLDFVAQCKPTSKEVVVELMTNNGLHNSIGFVDRKKGVYLEFGAVANQKEYLCRDKDIPSISIMLVTSNLTRPATLYRPLITSNMNNIVPLGKTVVLTCVVACCTGRKQDIEWFHDTKPIVPSSRVNISRINYTENPVDFCLDTIRQTVTIERLTLDDAGTYKCVVSDRRNDSNFVDFKLYVLELKPRNHRSNRISRDVDADNFVFFHTDSNPTTVNVSRSSDRPVRMVLGYEAYPSLTSVEWYKDGRRLNVSQDHRYQATETDTEVQLVISNVSLDDVGRYTAIAKSETVQDSYSVSVFVYDKPTLKLGSINTTLGTMVEFVCESHAFPKPVFDIGFLPCDLLDWRTCMGNLSQYKNMDSKETNISTIEVHRTIKFQANMSGIVLCVATNDYGKAEAEGYLIIVNSSLQFAVETVVISLLVVLTVVVVIVARRVRRFARFRQSPIAKDEELSIPKRYEFPRERLRLGSLIGSGQFGVVLQAIADGIVTEGEETMVAVKQVRDANQSNVLSVLIAELKVMIHIGHHLNVVNLLGAVTQNVPRNEMMIIVEHCKYGNVSDFLLKNRTNFIDELNPVTGQYTSTRNFEDLDLNDSVVGCTFSTSHLCSWAMQIAQGMSFLATRSVLHGDLAARNVLLCPGNVVKICDFGLARTLYRTNVYKKTSPDPLPLKWLALECITDRTFSTHSDVWAYGIVLWELFSLGKVPYPEQGNNVELVNALKQGYRMKKPSAANFEMYIIMLNCWRQDPTGRPSFEQLYQWFYNFLPQNIRMHHDQQLLTIDNNDGMVTILTDSCTVKYNPGYIDMKGFTY